VGFYLLLSVIFIGLSSQQTYSQLSDLLTQTGSGFFDGGWGAIGQAGLLLVTGMSGTFSPELSEVQQLYGVIILLLTWLTTVWLLRAMLAGNTPKLRDGIYNAGSPIVSTALVFFVILLQLVPAALAAISINAAVTTGLFDSGLISMLVSIGAALLVLVSLYWITSTLIALTIVTLPGMYPLQAIRAAGDLVVGRRVRILLRLLWLMLGNVLTWLVLIISTILLDTWLKQLIPAIEAVPIVPVVIAIVTSYIVVWSSAYVYLLYRKVVEDDAKPA
jgi:hypothetical protein